LVASIIPLVALFQVFDGVAGVSGGILRARGRQVWRNSFTVRWPTD
jgi:multidrug resistance protein, MATE family